MWSNVKHAAFLALLDHLFENHGDATNDVSSGISFWLHQVEALSEESAHLGATLIFRSVAVLSRELTIDKQAHGRLEDLFDFTLQGDLPDDIQVFEFGGVAVHREIWSIFIFLLNGGLIVLFIIPEDLIVAPICISRRLLLLLWPVGLQDVVGSDVGADKEHLDEVEASQGH